MLPNERDYFDGGEDHWVNNPFIPERQKIRMFNDMLELTKNLGKKNERGRVLAYIEERLQELQPGDPVIDELKALRRWL